MKKPKVSVCLLTYQQESTVAEAIRGIFEQSYPWTQLVVGDDCSSDSTLKIIDEELAKQNTDGKSIEIITSPENKGLASNLNRIMEKADGDLIVAAAGDDISEFDRIHEVVKCWRYFEERPVMFHSDAHVINADGLFMGDLCSKADLSKFSRNKSFEETKEVPGVELTTQAIVSAKLIGATQVWTNKIYEKFGSLNQNLMIEDEAMVLRASLLGSVVHITKPLVRYRVGGISSWDDSSQSVNKREAIAKKALMKMALYKQKIDDLLKVGADGKNVALAYNEYSFWRLIESSAQRSPRMLVDLIKASRSHSGFVRSLKESLRSACPDFNQVCISHFKWRQ
jgi:glycosyltransferase involved in cell wall biosynthesis